MKFKLLIVALLFSCFSFGQSIFTNPITGVDPNTNNPYIIGQTIDPNITVSGIGRGSGINGTAASNRYNADGWSTTTLDSNDYFEFTLTPNAGYQMNFVSFVYTSQISSGTASHVFRSSLDGFTTNIGTPTTTGTTISLSAGTYQNISTSITFRIYSFGLTAATTTFSINDFTFNGTVTAACTSPSTQASTFTSSAITTTTATVGWTRGNGNNVLVVARAGSAVTTDPSSGTTYTANAAFGSGSQIGTGNFVVYNGPLTSVNLTALTAGTTYHFALYEYNTTGTCYNQTQLIGNITTNSPTPVATIANNGAQVIAANVSQGTTDHVLHRFQITVTGATTNLTGIANLVMGGTYIASDIVNFKIRYSTDNVLDAGDATLSTKTVGLTGNQTFSLTTQTLPIGVSYIFITADFSATATVNNTISVSAFLPTGANFVFSSTPITLRSSTATSGGLQTIRPIAPNTPIALTEICTTNTTQSLSWSPPATGTFDGYMLVVREAATPHAVTSLIASSQTFNSNYTLAPTYGSTAVLSRVLYIGTATTATITGLTQGVNYTFAVYAYKNDGATSIYSTSATTTNQTINLPNVSGAGSSPANASGTITWSSPNALCYNEILVVATTAPGITFTPSGNGSAYMPNTVYAGNNSIVFNNAGNFVTVTGLTNGVTYYFEIFVRNGLEWSSGVEVSLTPNLATVFKPGELMFVGFDGQVEGSGQNDEYMVATMVDIIAGTTFSIVNSRYEAGAAANVRTDKWGGSGDDASSTPGVVNITYNTGQPLIPAGSVLVFRTDGTTGVFSSILVITGTTVSANRINDFTRTLPFVTAISAPNISTGANAGEQIYLVQGNFVYDGTTEPTEANYILSGTLLHGFTLKIGWIPLTTACDGSVGSTFQRQSRLPAALTCFNVESTSNNVVGYYENSAQHGSTSVRNIIQGIANVTTNWTISNSRYTIDATSNLATRAGKTFIIGASETAGQWIGDFDTNWFNCANWGRLTVPDETVDVVIDNVTSINNSNIDFTSSFSDFYNDLAVCNNLNINGRRLIIQGNPNNELEVYGNVTIGASGILDMNDSVNGTPDGQLYLYGNWNNNGTETNFDQGESTIHFRGSVAQVINNVAPRGTELFYNVVLDNDFNTAISNDLIAQGDLTINATRVLNIDSNGFVFAYRRLNHNGDLSIANNGQFIQVDETDNNTGVYTGTRFQLTRTAQAKNFDYVYWSAPTENFAVTSIPTNNRYEWNTLFANANGTLGNWATASGTMTRGKGYIARASNGSATPVGLSTIFTGKPHNGQFDFAINRGNYDGADYDADLTNPNNVLTTRFDDNWNLVGNPYPSAIDAEEFLVQNQTKIEGAVWIWTHGLNPTSNVSPFYSNYQYNYSSSDYIKYNGLGSTEPDTFAGKIASGQGFMVNMLHTAATPNTITFTNNMRSDASMVQYDNTDFFRSASTNTNGPVEEKHRIWLDIINTTSGQMDRTLLGYSTSSTLDVDHLYDCIFRPTSELSMFSIINSEPFIIQGRPLPFNNFDLVPMGIRIVAAGNHTIAIKKVDGLFEQNQDIYLEDKQLNIIHDLRQAPYNFTSSVGTFNDRFVLRYTTAALSNQDFESIDSSVIVSANDGQIKVKSINESLSEVSVYDVLGREILKKTNIASSDLTLSNITAKNQALILKIKLENGEVVTRKVIL
ncbi:T9SS sorting signal type C domain-containing protein [Flavobacterium sp.]|jgi:hypothetical protein|uniref:T9SS sorting signal type C domain-containing protein n=1 Tax=Flavobacterium sp. TaxID=239 RepID=UPI0037BF9B58